jgi:broad specificity phosphatase PhoE
VDTRFVFVRHGRTKISPRPEGWLKSHLSNAGEKDAAAGATFLSEHLERPSKIISSDLPRSEESALIAAHILGVGRIDSRRELRAYDAAHESKAAYEKRSEQALQRILAEPGTPLLVGHRSYSSWLSYRYGLRPRSDDPGFTKALVSEGGALSIGNLSEGASGLTPLFRSIPEHWPGDLGREHVFRDDEDDSPEPDEDDEDEKYRALRRFVTAAGYEHRGRRDLTPVEGDNSARYVWQGGPYAP